MVAVPSLTRWIPMLSAALVIVDLEDDGDQQLTGTILSVVDDDLSIEPDSDRLCGQALDVLELSLTDELEIMTVTITDLGSEIAPGGEPAAGQLIGMNGECIGGVYDPSSLFLVDDQRTP